MENLKIEWDAPEYEETEKGADWYWALGVVVVAGSIASIIFSNYFFAILLVISGALLAFYSIKKPVVLYHEFNETGLKINREIFPFINMKAYWLRTNSRPTLFIKLDRPVMPVISMPINVAQAEQINNLFVSKKIIEEEMKEHMSEKVMEYFGL